MSAPMSTHLPEVSGEVVAVTGTLLVDTGLRKIQSFSATLAQTPTVDAANATAVPQDIEAGQTQKLLLQVWEDDLVTPAAVAANVAWAAFGQ